MTEPVGTVWRDFDFEDFLGREELAEGSADGSVRRQNQKPIGSLAEAELLGAAHHSLALNTAELADLDLEITGHDGAGLGERNLVTDLVILGAADDLMGRTASVIDLADAETISIRVLDRFQNLGGHNLRNRHAGRLNRTDFETGIGQDPGDLGSRFVGAEIIPQPGEGNLHAVNRERKRRSFSVSIRMSETPVRFMASRSRPKPKAKPFTFSGS